MKILLIILCLNFIININAQAETWKVDEGQLTYHVQFPLKKIDGISTSVKGKAICNNNCHVLAAATIKSFDSGDTNRDYRVLKLTEATKHPFVSCVLDLKMPDKNTKTADITVNLAGKDKKYQNIPINIDVIDKDHLKINGTIPMKLTDFNIEPPSLLGISIEDEVPVDLELKWSKVSL